MKVNALKQPLENQPQKKNIHQKKEEANVKPRAGKKTFFLPGSIYLDPFILSFLEKLPKDVADSFTELQLLQIKLQFGTRTKAKHAIDVRSVMGGTKWRYYFVLLLGRNRRDLSRTQGKWIKGSRRLFLFLCVLFSVLIIFISLYLIKSFLGIDIFPNHSLGLWHWLSA